LSDIISAPVTAIIGFLAQMVDGTVGMGFGAFSASLLIAAGFYPATASAMIHVAKIFTGAFNGVAHLRLGNVRRRWLWPLAVPGMLGGATGAYLLASVIPGRAVRPYVALFLMGLGVLIVYRFRTGRALALEANGSGLPHRHKIPRPRLAALGFLAGFVDAVGGGGWGPVATPGLIVTGNSEPRKAVGTVNLAEVFVALAISVTFILTLGFAAVANPLTAGFLVGGLLAAIPAAWLCTRLPAHILGTLVGLALIGLNLRTILEVIFR